MEMHISGVNIHYELAGSGAKRVVLLHGWGCSTELMKPVADELSADMTVLSVDFPAHGKSTQPPEPWGVPEFAACLKELLIKLIVDQMPEQRKKIFTMSRYQGLSNDQIAKSLGLSKHTIENNISLALKELREVMLAFIIFLLN